MFLIIRGKGCFMIFKCKQTEKCNIFLIWEKCRCLKSKTLVVDGCQVTIWFTVLIQNSIDAQSLEGFKCAATNQTLGQEQSVWIIKWDEVGFIYVEFENFLAKHLYCKLVILSYKICSLNPPPKKNRVMTVLGSTTYNIFTFRFRYI